MELDKILTLIQEVSNSTLTEFILEEGNMHLELRKGTENVEETAQEELKKNQENESNVKVQMFEIESEKEEGEKK